MIDTLKTKEKVKTLAEKYGLSLAVLFGSKATGRTHLKSDVDIAVLSNNKFDSKIIDDFYDLFKREDVEVVDLATASPTLMYVVVRDGKLLYEKESEAFFNWKLYAMWVWRDTAWLRKLRDRKLVEWAKTV